MVIDMLLRDDLLHMSKGGCFSFSACHTEMELIDLYTELYGVRPKNLSKLEITELCYCYLHTAIELGFDDSDDTGDGFGIMGQVVA